MVHDRLATGLGHGTPDEDGAADLDRLGIDARLVGGRVLGHREEAVERGLADVMHDLLWTGQSQVAIALERHLGFLLRHEGLAIGYADEREVEGRSVAFARLPECGALQASVRGLLVP